MISKIQKLIKTFKAFLVYRLEYDYYTGNSFSQNFEDLVFCKLLENCNYKNISKIYIDIGAHHPIRFSNTYILNKKGWKGINIDPLPSCIELFNKFRPNDINLNIGISNKPGKIEYYNFEEPAYNTINSERAQFVIKSNYTKLIEKRTIQIDSIENVLDNFFTKEFCEDLRIGLLTIDVETMELDVLKSNNWEKYRPSYIILESIINVNEKLDNIYQDNAVKFLSDLNYVIVAKVGNAVFLKDADI